VGLSNIKPRSIESRQRSAEAKISTVSNSIELNVFLQKKVHLKKKYLSVIYKNTQLGFLILNILKLCKKDLLPFRNISIKQFV
jgi:hypothetical protein